MTREIALHCMKSASELERELCEECPIYGQTGCDHCFEDALQYVIEMLEQEPVLDELRAEITILQNRCYALTKGTMCAFCRYECEYKAETEDKA